MTCPRLIPGTHYGPRGKWAVGLLQPIGYALGRDLGAIYEFYSGETLLARHERGWVDISEVFACDGYSPTIRIGKRFVRLTPTPKAGMFPAINHDLQRQFCEVEGCPWDRMDTDIDFYNALVAGGTHPHIAGTFYSAIAGPLGSAYLRITRKPDSSLRIVRTEYPS